MKKRQKTISIPLIAILAIAVIISLIIMIIFYKEQNIDKKSAQYVHSYDLNSSSDNDDYFTFSPPPYISGPFSSKVNINITVTGLSMASADNVRLYYKWSQSSNPKSEVTLWDTHDGYVNPDTYENDGLLKKATFSLSACDTTGEYYLYVRCVGFASLSNGNPTNIVSDIKATTLYAYYFDCTPPQRPAITNPTLGQWTNESIKINVSATDVDAEVERIRESWDKITWSDYWQEENFMQPTATASHTYTEESDQTLYVKAIDSVGNESEISSTKIRIDKTSPTAGTLTMKLNNSTGINYVNNTPTNQDVYIAKNNGTDALSGHASTVYTINGGEEKTASTTLTKTGIYKIAVKTTDNAGNSATNTYTVIINKTEEVEDTTAPTLNITNPSNGNWTKGPVTVTATASDESGIKKLQYKIGSGGQWTDWSTNATASMSLSAVYYGAFHVKAIDNAGNEATKSTNLKIEDSAPTITNVTQNTTEWTKGSVTLTINGVKDVIEIGGTEYNASGLHATPYSFDGGTTWQTGNTKTYNTNTNGIVIKVRDTLGNVYTHSAINITNIDTTKPQVTSVIKSTTEWTNNPVTLTVTATDAGAGLAEKAYSFDGGTTWQAENTKTYNSNTDGIVIKVKDALENVYTHTEINITNIDIINPEVTSVTRSTTEWTKGPVTITVIASDVGVGLAEKAYSFDGGTSWQSKNTKTYNENTAGIFIKVRDILGNTYTHNGINIINIDVAEPQITSVTKNITEWTKDPVTLTVEARDNGVGLAEKAYSFDGGTTWQTEKTKTYNANTNGIVIKVKDALENVYTHSAINITNIDTTKPEITAVTQSTTELTENPVTITVTASDSGVGLAEKAYSFDGGANWQTENTKTYNVNTNGIVIKVRDALDNVYTHENTINITNIKEENEQPGTGNEGGETPPPSGDGDEGGETPPPSGDGDDEGETPPPSGDGDDDGKTPPPSEDGDDDGKTPPLSEDEDEENKNLDNSIADKNYNNAGRKTVFTIIATIMSITIFTLYRKTKKLRDI